MIENKDCIVRGQTTRKKVLIVDNSKINRQVLRNILSKDYEILEAVTLKEAINTLHESYQSISAVLLDLDTPIINGYEILETLRRDAFLSQIPVIVTISSDASGAEIKALSLGAQDFLIKPYQPYIIKHRLANAIYLRETAAFINAFQYDVLTGVLTKECFYKMTANILKNNPDKKYDIICCDIEKFKLVNDLYGTCTGDELLKHCARVLDKYKGENDICGRIGADVFAILLLHKDNYDSQYFATINEEINRFHINLNIVIRYGIYMIDDPKVPVNIMCDRACLAVASTKGLYDIYYKFYDVKIRQKLLDEQYITANMKKALQDGQFDIYLQPKYELKTEKIIGAEALVRWNNPEKGFISPEQFIPLFEKNGFITDLDIYVWESCCKLIRNWMDRGRRLIPISTNVSRIDIYNPHIDEILMSLVDKYHISPQCLYLEITESAYTENSKQLIETVKKLKELGFVIEMDDFGSGYSSLNMLSDLPIDILKLDIGFLQNKEKKVSRSILSFIINLAKWLNLGVIAEGTETAEQVYLLHSLNCECAQGYYFAKPMPVAELERMLDNQFGDQRDEQQSHKKVETMELNTYHPQTVLVLDNNLIDYFSFKSVFADKYIVTNTVSVEETIHYIQEYKTDISAVLFVFSYIANMKELLQVTEASRLYNIPVISFHTSKGYMEEAINAGAMDCIEKPYVLKVMRNQIENAICRAQIFEFQKQRDYNLNIMDIKKRAERDALTGLLNRWEFEYRVQQFILNHPGETGIFIILDVDNFKVINDTYGHTTGDVVLQHVGSYLHYLFPETEMIGRMGGDEFAVFIPGVINKQQLVIKAKKMCHALDVDTDMVQVSCSAGISMFPYHGSNFRTLYECSDLALLLAKRTGKCQYKFYHTGMKYENE